MFARCLSAIVLDCWTRSIPDKISETMVDRNSNSSSRTNRNLIERARRSNMRNLYSRLFSFIPPQPTRMSIPDMVEQVIIYISQYQRHLEELRQRRSMLLQEEDQANRASTSQPRMSPVLNIIDSDNSSMEVNLITGSNVQFAISEIIRNIEEEGAEVISVTYNNAGNMNILSIHCQAAFFENGINRSRLLQRLRTMIEE